MQEEEFTEKLKTHGLEYEILSNDPILDRILKEAAINYKEGDLQNAIKYYTQVLDKEGSGYDCKTTYILQLAVLQVEVGDVDGALKMIERGLDCSGGNLDLLKLKAKILKAQGNLEGTKKCLDSIKQADKAAENIECDLDSFYGTTEEEDEKILENQERGLDIACKPFVGDLGDIEINLDDFYGSSEEEDLQAALNNGSDKDRLLSLDKIVDETARDKFYAENTPGITKSGGMMRI